MTSEPVGGRYRLLKDIGKGGMGKVWLADDLVLRRPVALKQLLPQFGHAELRELRDRALIEARALAAVNHPNVVRIYDVLTVGDDPWLVMEYIEGRSLYHIIRDERPDERAIARIALPVLNGLCAAHGCGVIHRDVKPTNILLADKGRAVFLVDFGIAKIDGETTITKYPGGTPGTVDYVAPERLRGEVADAASDLWALGVTMFFALEGYSPFLRAGHEATRWAILSERTPELSTTGRLANLVVRLLDKDPERRARADEAGHELRAIVDDPQVPLRLSQQPTTNVIARADGSLSAPSRFRPTPANSAEPPLNQTQLDDAREAIRRASPESGAAMLLAMPEEKAAQLLAGMHSREAGSHIQAIAAHRRSAAGAILKILSSSGAGHAVDYVSASVVASVLADMQVLEAARILSRTSARTAAQVIMILPDSTSVRFIKAMPTKQAGLMLNFVWPSTVKRLFDASDEVRRKLENELDPALRTQVRRLQ